MRIYPTDEELGEIIRKLAVANPRWPRDYTRSFAQGMIDGAQGERDHLKYSDPNNDGGYRAANDLYTAKLRAKQEYKPANDEIFGKPVVICQRCRRQFQAPCDHLCQSILVGNETIAPRFDGAKP